MKHLAAGQTMTRASAKPSIGSVLRKHVLSPLMGCRTSDYIRMLRRYGVHPRYWPRALTTLLLTMTGAPLRWYETHKVRRRLQTVKVQQPVFIIGFWRSGTTLLHNLLTQDPQAAYVSQFQTLFPHSVVTNSLARAVLRPFMPKTRPMDNVPVQLDSPQEEEMAMAVLGTSYYTTWYFPNYEDRLVQDLVYGAEVKPAWKEAYHRQLRKALLISGGNRLILKNPANTVRIPSLLSLYPDAQFVHLVRDPYEVFCSTVRLYRKARPYFTHHHDARREDERVISTYRLMMQTYLNDRAAIPQGQLVELRYEELMTHPRESVAAIYQQFGMPLTGQTGERLNDYLASIAGYRPAAYPTDDRLKERLRNAWDFVYDEFGY